MIALAGPIVAGLAILVGRLLGAQLGELGGVIAAVAIAIVLAFAIHRWRPIGVATFFVFGFVGAMNAYVGNSFELMRSGEHVLGAHLDDVASWRTRQRLTFADGGSRRGLGGSAGHTAGRNDSRNTTTYYYCDAIPIVPLGWAEGSAIRIWSFADGRTSTPFTAQTFHPVTKLDDDCTRALANAISKHALVQAADPIYLERVDTVVDPYFLNLQGVVPAILAAVIWLLVVVSRRRK